MDFPEFFAIHIEKNNIELCREWLDRLMALLNVDAEEAFPSQELLDHVPDVIHQIAGYLRPEVTDEVQTASAVTEKARQMGDMRFSQGATTHQILREYELLTELLEQRLEICADTAPKPPTAREMLFVTQRLHRMVRVLLQSSVDAFTEQYTTMIDEQREKLITFNRAVSHELRTPLGTLEISSALLEEEMSKEGVARVAGLIRNSVTKMTEIVKSLESISHVDVEAEAPTRQQIDLGALGQDIAQQLAEMAEARQVQVRIGADLPLIYSDLHLVEMILMNLIANAIKYSDPGKTERSVEMSAELDDRDFLAITISDNGLGVGRSEREAIFGRFYRAHATDDEELGNSGSGLGLSIVQDCLDALDGTVTLDSEEGVGSTFTVTLPVSVPAEG